MDWRVKKYRLLLVLLSACVLLGTGINGENVYADEKKPENKNSQSMNVTAYVEHEDTSPLNEPSGEKDIAIFKVKTGDMKITQEQFLLLGMICLILIIAAAKKLQKDK